MTNEISRTILRVALCAGAALLSASLLANNPAELMYAQPAAVSTPDPIGSTGNCSQASPPSAAASAAFRRLSFCDDFDSIASIDVHDTGDTGYKWYPHTPGNNLTPKDFSVAHSELTVEDTDFHNSWGLATFNYRTHKGHTFQFGYFEARIDFDPTLKRFGGQGWPAFWGLSVRHVMSGLKKKDPTPWTELDFFEAFKGDRGPHHAFFGGTVHVWKSDGTNATNVRNKQNTYATLVDWTQWHTVGCLWTKDKITWYLDGTKVGQQSYSANSRGNQPALDEERKVSVPNGVFKLVDSDSIFLILGTGPKWPMNVDWVRVWQ
jgi:beta-glucanase (GH16 family)